MVEVPPAPLETQATAEMATGTVMATVAVTETAVALAVEVQGLVVGRAPDQATGMVAMAQATIITANQQLTAATITVAAKDTANTPKTTTTTKTTDRVLCPKRNPLLAFVRKTTV